MSKRYFLIFFTTFKKAVPCFKLPFYSMQKYLKYSTLGLILVCISVVSPGFKMSIEPSIENCKDFDVKLTITHTSNGQKNGEAIMEYKNADSYTYFIFSGSNQDNRLEGKGAKISNLDKGDYNLYIQSPDGCTKHMKFKIN
jgi:hypothetical protein